MDMKSAKNTPLPSLLPLTLLLLLSILCLTGCRTASDNPNGPEAGTSSSGSSSLQGASSSSESATESSSPGTSSPLPPAAPDDDRTVLTIGAWSAPRHLISAVIAFNAANTDYRVEILTEESAEYEDYMQRKSARLTSGRGEDIVWLASDLRTQRYIEQGVLEDLRPYMERDLQADDYLKDVLHAFEQGEKVYAVVPFFHLTALAGNMQYLGENGELSLEELPNALKKANPTDLMGRADPLDSLWCLFEHYRFDFANEEELRSCILLAQNYTHSIPKQEEGTKPVRQELGRDAFFMETGLFGPSDILNMEHAYGVLGKQFAFVQCGKDGSRALLDCDAYGINTASQHKDGAWKFLRYLLDREKQMDHARTGQYNFPVLKDAYLSMVHTDYQKQEAQFETESLAPSDNAFVNGSEQPILRPEEEYLGIMEELLKNSRVRCLDVDYDAWTIISEETASYYSGQKSLDAVLPLIQNRLTLYLKEK